MAIDLSFIVPFYYGEHYIGRLINSIVHSYEASKSTLCVQIVIVIDSPDTNQRDLEPIRDIVKELFLFQLIKNQSNIGVSESRNIGIANSVGSHIVCIDQDDEIALDYFKYIDAGVLDRYDFILLNGYFRFRASCVQTRIYYIPPSISTKNVILYDVIRSPGQVIVSREILARTGFPSPKKHFGADDKFSWILLFAVNKNLRKLFVSKPLYIAHYHDKNFSSNNSKQLYQCMLEMYQQLAVTHEKELKPFNKYIRENINFNNFLLREKGLFTLGEIRSAIAYYSYPNKVIGFFVKHVRKFKQLL